MRCVEGPFPSEVGASRLEILFAEIARSVEEGQLEAAYRLADCACRIAPTNSTCLVVYARILIRLGAASEAVERLRGRKEPDVMVSLGEALYAQELFDDAAACCETLLRRYEINSVENLRYLAARLCSTQRHANCQGWVGISDRLRLVGQVRRGREVKIAWAGGVFSPTTWVAGHDGLDSFAFEVPTGVSGWVEVCAGDVGLLGSAFAWPPDFGFCGWVVMENETLVGKVRLEWAPALATTLAITRSGGKYTRLLPVPAVGSFGPSVGSPFSIALDQSELDAFHVEVSAVLPDGRREPLLGSPVGVQPVSPTPIDVCSRRTVHPAPVQECGLVRKPQLIDIVIPVYAGRAETLVCVERVLATTERNAAEIVVINDATPDMELCEALTRLAQEGRVTLLTNQSNMGFPGAANRGMNLHPERDVVLLNSDTEVFGDWLDRLACAAYWADDIGTVTPLGEGASITNYRAESGRAVEEPREIDRIAREVNAGKIVELPVGVGFCLYLRRDCITEVGRFDENTFGKGYGEENDFCLRARKLGWRHIAATNVFVRHRGGCSYGSMKGMLVERNRRVLNALHPGYEALVASFAAADPLLDPRREIDMRRLCEKAIDPVLLMTLDLPGGVKRHVDSRQSELHGAGHTVVVLKPSGARGQVDQAILNVQDWDLENLVFRLPEEGPILRALLLRLRLSHIELHHFVGLPAEALELAVGLGIRYDVYIHDYSWVCPRVTLVGGNGVYCGEPPIHECEACVRAHGTALEESLTVAALRARSARILDGASTVVAPSEDARMRLVRYFPNLRIKVVAWEAPIVRVSRATARRNGRVRVAVIGAVGIQKGHQILLECAQDAADRDLDLDFSVIGYTCDDEPLLATGRVFITGPYAESEIETLFEREQCHIAFFPSVSPETWCYALSHALAWGLPILAFDHGAIAERLQSYAAAELLPLSTTAAKINDSLTALYAENHYFSPLEGVCHGPSLITNH